MDFGNKDKARKPKLNFIDRTIGFFSPEHGAKRAFHRARYTSAFEIFARRFEAAGFSRRTNGFKNSTSASVNVENGPALHVLRNRSRDMSRNNGYWKRAIEIIASETVGDGIVPLFRGKKPKAKKRAEELDALWKSFAESTEIDLDGKLDFYGIQDLAMRTIAESGEILIRRKMVRKYKTLPLRLEVLEPDFLDTNKTESLKNGAKVLQGKEYDSEGQLVAYWLYESHPGGFHLNGYGMESKRHDVKDILHLYRVDRPGQVRGIAWGASVMIRAKDFEDFEDAHLVQKKIASCFSAFVYDSVEPEDNEDATEISQSDSFEPGMIEYLGPGKDVKFGTPPSLDDYTDFTEGNLRGIAMGFGISYESLTGNLAKLSFSAGRMSRQNFQPNLRRWRRYIMVTQLCVPFLEWFYEAARFMGYNTDDIVVTWIPPKSLMIDPVKETNANKTAVENGFKTPSQVVREEGRDPNDHFEEYAEDMKRLKDLGISLKCVTPMEVSTNENDVK